MRNAQQWPNRSVRSRKYWESHGSYLAHFIFVRRYLFSWDHGLIWITILPYNINSISVRRHKVNGFIRKCNPEPLLELQFTTQYYYRTRTVQLLEHQEYIGLLWVQCTSNSLSYLHFTFFLITNAFSLMKKKAKIVLQNLTIKYLHDQPYLYVNIRYRETNCEIETKIHKIAHNKCNGNHVTFFLRKIP